MCLDLNPQQPAAGKAEAGLGDETLFTQYCETRNRSAFESLMLRNQTFAYRAAFAIAGNHTVAEDGVQEAFLRILSCSPGMGRRVPCFRPWFYCVVVRATRNILRKDGRRANRESNTRLAGNAIAALSSAVDELVQRETSSRFNEVFEAMADETRVPLVLQYFEGCTQMEIGALLGMSQSQVSRRIATGLGYLRTHLERCGITATTVSGEFKQLFNLLQIAGKSAPAA